MSIYVYIYIHVDLGLVTQKLRPVLIRINVFLWHVKGEILKHIFEHI